MADKETVFVCEYHHKHGCDIGVYRTEKGATDGAHALAAEQVSSAWDDVDTRRFWETTESKGHEEAIDLFNELENEVSQGERLEISESELFA